MPVQKRTYELPVLNTIGTFESLTKAAKTGFALDAGFPAHTPVSQLTFS